ncbi:hypothetical protein [Microbacterium sp. C7(2022)]|uniref:hypothetical protein n=1 Tax=Microbacterium sp. C7(2022) TaxID=2992759 RepID=UPI00237AD65E|nr:hypothetical protein [Microbacterium sp. C7(2022)]MDE0545769.1 hypothetical protein [Microbacterium sp. C7(2022)]
MDTRVKYAVGGVAVVSASVSMLLAVAMTTATTLADSAGMAIASEPVIIDGANPEAQGFLSADAAPVAPSANAESVRVDVVEKQDPQLVTPHSVSTTEPASTRPAAAVNSPESTAGAQSNTASSWAPTAKPARDDDSSAKRDSRDRDSADTRRERDRSDEPRTTKPQDSKATPSSTRRDKDRSPRSTDVANQTRSHDSPDRRDR